MGVAMGPIGNGDAWGHMINKDGGDVAYIATINDDIYIFLTTNSIMGGRMIDLVFDDPTKFELANPDLNPENVKKILQDHYDSIR